MSNTRNSHWIKILISLLFISALAVFFVFDGQRYLSLEALQEHRDLLLDFTQRHYWQSLLIAVGVYTAATAFSIPGAVLLSLATGFLFGRWIGTGVIVIAATAGATLVFLAARYLFADSMRAKLGGRMREMSEGFARDGFNYLLFLRMVPLFPFWLVNLAPAFTGIKVPTYALATAIGIIPGSFVFANLGQSLGRIESTAELVSTETLLALGLLGLLALVPVLIKKFKLSKEA
ncbi:MAG: TVP38/TMEM64 family protein [Methylophilaceae bacterium]|nr:TVP38/TMEM64 family protein [Methylophilaceae bacterium]